MTGRNQVADRVDPQANEYGVFRVRLREHLSNFPPTLKRALAALERQVLSGSDPILMHAAPPESLGRSVVGVRTLLDRPNHKLRPADVQTLVQRYQAGTAITELARQFTVHEQTVRAHLQRAGVEIRQQRVLSDEQVAEIVELYRSGSPLRPLARQYGVAYNSIRNYLLRAGVELRPPRRLPGQAASD